MDEYYLKDVIEDLTHSQLIEMINEFSIKQIVPSRANIMRWRRENGLV